MKRFALLFITAFLFAGPIGAEVTNAIAALNQEVDRILTPFRNDQTQATFVFNDIQTNAERALALKLEGLYKKTGAANSFEVRIDNLEYAFGDGSAPIVQAKGFIGTDLTKIFSQDDLNRMIPEIDKMIEGFSASYTQQYGEAATVNAVVLEKGQDQSGNYVSIKGTIAVKMDLLKLPQSVKSEDVMFTELTVALTVDLKTGVSVDLKMTMNPAFRAFQKDQAGLKEDLDKLLNKDAAQIQQIESGFKELESIATRIVNGAQ